MGLEIAFVNTFPQDCAEYISEFVGHYIYTAGLGGDALLPAAGGIDRG
ncbi:hypothetical protein PT2222_300094 [Paraburkholderia tropica]